MWGAHDMDRAVLGFVSGSGKREENIRRAIRSVERLPATTVIAQSDLYGQETQAAVQSESDCTVACAVVLTGMSPCALYGACKGIAAAVGREPDVPAQEAAVDISLLVYEGAACKNDELTLPNEDLLRRPAIRKVVTNIFRNGKVLDFNLTWPEKKKNSAP